MDTSSSLHVEGHIRSGMWLAHAQRDLSFAVEPMDNDAPCAMGAQRPLWTRPEGPENQQLPTAPWWQGQRFGYQSSPGHQLEPYLAQFRLAAWHNGWCTEEAVVHLALAFEGTAAWVLLDLDQADQ
ncbi:unnamed protein product [Boreogadus saida]